MDVLRTGHSATCNEIPRIPRKIVMRFTSFLSAVMPPEIAEILSLYNGRFLALKWTGVNGFALILSITTW